MSLLFNIMKIQKYQHTQFKKLDSGYIKNKRRFNIPINNNNKNYIKKI